MEKENAVKCQRDVSMGKVIYPKKRAFKGRVKVIDVEPVKFKLSCGDKFIHVGSTDYIR